MHSLRVFVIHLLLFVASSLAFPFDLMPLSNEKSLERRQGRRHCSVNDKNDFEIIPNTHYIVFNMMYNKQDIKVGNVCTVFNGLQGSTIRWASDWNLPRAQNPDTVKGYSFIGLTIKGGGERQLRNIAAIPVTYTWSFTNVNFKGNVVLDYMIAPSQGDITTPGQAQELMLWLTWKNGQVPIGFERGKRQTINFLGKSWSMYQGVNRATGLTVTSLLADGQFGGSFSGNTKEWLLALANQAKLFPPDTTWVNVINGGVEPFWGTVTIDASLDMRIA